jgi:hypothetical protein
MLGERRQPLTMSLLASNASCRSHKSSSSSSGGGGSSGDDGAFGMRARPLPAPLHARCTVQRTVTVAAVTGDRPVEPETNRASTETATGPWMSRGPS